MFYFSVSYLSMYQLESWIKEIYNKISERLVLHLSHIVRKPVNGICDQHRRRSACASAQSDQCLCCSLPR